MPTTREAIRTAVPSGAILFTFASDGTGRSRIEPQSIFFITPFFVPSATWFEVIKLMSVLDGTPAAFSWVILLSMVGKSGPGVYWSFRFVPYILFSAATIGLNPASPSKRPPSHCSFSVPSFLASSTNFCSAGGRVCAGAEEPSRPMRTRVTRKVIKQPRKEIMRLSNMVNPPFLSLTIEERALRSEGAGFRVQRSKFKVRNELNAEPGTLNLEPPMPLNE